MTGTANRGGGRISIGSLDATNSAVAVGHGARASAATDGSPVVLDARTELAALREQLQSLIADQAGRPDGVDAATLGAALDRVGELDDALAGPEPDRGRIRRALGKLTETLAGAAVFTESVQRIGRVLASVLG